VNPYSGAIQYIDAKVGIDPNKSQASVHAIVHELPGVDLQMLD
jgi:hypothetical protein